LAPDFFLRGKPAAATSSPVFGRSEVRILPYDYAVRNLGRAPLRLVATVGGCALVVLIMMAATAFVQGMRRSLTPNLQSRNVLLLSAGSEESLERSQINAGVPSHVRASVSGIKQRLGEPFISPEIHLALIVSRPQQTEELRAIFRGVDTAAFLVHPRVQLTVGEAPRHGHNELLVGALAAEKLNIPEADLSIGNSLIVEDEPWTIVGRFAAPGTVMDAEIWTSYTDLQVATQRNSLSCVVISLEEAELADLAAWTAVRLDLELVAMSEAEYYASLRRFYGPVRAMIWATATLMALAGILGGLNTLYAAFAARTRELGMLQSLGYSRSAILISLLQESMLASAAGALFGAVLAYGLLHGNAVRFSMGVFELQVDALTVFIGLLSGLLLGFIGALPPAFRCLRLPIPVALRT
jgi:putative ABC transport system permease protein